MKVMVSKRFWKTTVVFETEKDEEIDYGLKDMIKAAIEEVLNQ